MCCDNVTRIHSVVLGMANHPNEILQTAPASPNGASGNGSQEEVVVCFG